MSTEHRTTGPGGAARTGSTTSTTSTTGGAGGPAAAHLEDVRRSAEFEALRRSFRRVVFPTTAAFLAWYALYVLLAAYAPEFMGTRVGGSTITIGLLLGLGQFVTTFAITMAYRRWADRRFDARAEALRAQITGGAR
ncbi:DUF485 domain-containing protein [Streptomyces sp. NP160]|uniref:DUF485 domain-containing protein n=1 Tax=Streptomyces sp. NP160 TaxID=2586637 RepID=UPI00111B5108|nr:DUF485 domain-containing protein [Streptomyces sp. NP160]TNM68027.1 DUF485 domain-containing protein [Streptomyces sp. NP160]